MFHVKQAAVIDEKAFDVALTQALPSVGVTLSEEQMELMSKFYVFLIDTNNKMNLTAITEPAQVAEKHMADSLRLLPYLKKGDMLADVGTGAGLPGIPLAIACPDVKVVLVESMQKRVNYLEAVVSHLGLKNIEIVCARAEEIGQEAKYREKFNIATARAVAALPVLAEYLLPLVKIGGKVLAMKSIKAEEELMSSQNAINILGGAKVNKVDYELLSGEHRSIIMVEKIKTTPKSYPRKVGMPAAKPL